MCHADKVHICNRTFYIRVLHMVLVIGGNSEIGAHVYSKVGD